MEQHVPMIDRLMAVRGALTAVLLELEWDNLATSEWKTLEALRDLLHPFAQLTSLIARVYKEGGRVLNRVYNARNIRSEGSRPLK